MKIIERFSFGELQYLNNGSVYYSRGEAERVNLHVQQSDFVCAVDLFSCLESVARQHAGEQLN